MKASGSLREPGSVHLGLFEINSETEHVSQEGFPRMFSKNVQSTLILNRCEPLGCLMKSHFMSCIASLAYSGQGFLVIYLS